jgi:hypothetical protein
MPQMMNAIDACFLPRIPNGDDDMDIFAIY